MTPESGADNREITDQPAILPLNAASRDTDATRESVRRLLDAEGLDALSPYEQRKLPHQTW